MFNVYYILWIILITGNINYVKSVKNADDNTLKMVHVVFRHGPRTGTATIPYQLYKNSTYPPYGKGHLINSGKKDLYETGVFLRQRYGSFLGKNFIPEAIYAETTNMYRCYMSVALILAGLFPPSNTDMNWNNALNWQPVPIYSKKLTKHNLLLHTFSCPRVIETLTALTVKQLAIIQANVKDFLDLDQLERDWGNKITSTIELANMYNAVKAVDDYGLPLPNWSTKYYPDFLEKVTNEVFLLFTKTEELKRVQVGPFFKKLINDWLTKIGNSLVPKEQKFLIYSAHDITIVNIMNSLNIWYEKFAYSGVTTIFELIQSNKSGKYGVQIYIRNDPKDGLIPLTIPDCQEHFCPIEKFMEITNNMTRYGDLDIDCKQRNSKFKNPLQLNCETFFCT